MYQPYVRGKQFELIGLRELTENGLFVDNVDKISPIIEPVRDSSTLRSTIAKFADKGVNFTLIVNPQVGNFRNIEKIFEVLNHCIALEYNNYQIGIIFHQNIDHKKAVEVLSDFEDKIPAFSIIHNIVEDDVKTILTNYEKIAKIRYNVINLSLTSRRYNRNFRRETLVELDDYFKSQSRNSDYLKIGDSFFSEEHLYYKEEGFEGFSDFLSIGEDYSDSGFLPYAVAIHLSYQDSEGRLRIRHFVSDTNDDSTDIAGKFSEALEKLIEWCNSTKFDSVVIPVYRKYHKEGHFPGLGTLKKLSLMNHIDIVLKLI